MTIPLRILIADDSETDFSLILRVLGHGGYEVKAQRVDSGAALRACLKDGSWEIVVSDYDMPSFTALDALLILKDSGLEIPFIIVSGAIGEETAVDLMKAGADDYILKSNMKRLAPAVARSLRDSATRARERESKRIAEQAILDREQMLAVVSHDLKNPLGAIQLNAKLIERLLAAPARPDREKLVQVQVGRIQRSVSRMSHLINDILDVAKIEAGRFVVERSENQAEELLSEVLDTFEPLAMQKSIRLRAELPGSGRSDHFDREKLFQVISNLVGNALKFTPERGDITVSLAFREIETSFSVYDTGPGIAESDLPHIFDRFWQADRLARTGTGLGLSIAKGIVEAHGGRIWAESRAGGGSTFHFTIPHARAGEGA